MNALIENIKEVKLSFLAELNTADNEADIEKVRITFLGRQGKISELMIHLKQLTGEDRKTAGQLLNELKETCTVAFTQKQELLRQKTIDQELKKQQWFDVTASTPHQLQGSLHPMTHMVQEVEDIFLSMGYRIATGPEVENEHYNFEALNIPKDHPARDMWDTFYIDVPGMLLRTHTSTVQIHEMEKQEFPIALIAPGRCYRHEATDATHDFVFMQVEGLFIDKNVSISNLLATVKAYLQALFKEKKLDIRIRPNYYPFVEPGIDIDMSCPFCTKGCSVCKKSRWIEISGAGMIHPNVLKACNIDPQQYSGFAFGSGLTRLAMLKYGINDIRLLHTAKIEFLKQF